MRFQSSVTEIPMERSSSASARNTHTPASNPYVFRNGRTCPNRCESGRSKYGRTHSAPPDLLIWIEQTGTLVAKRGVWADGSKSTRMHYVTMNYVVPTRRGRGLAKRMILSMAHELSKTDSSVKFIFELHDVPRSLYTATPFLRFSYVWIPFFASETWLEVADPRNFRRPGFTPDHWTGFQLFVSNKNYVLIDPHDTVVWYDSFDSLLTFDKRPGAYVRWFWPFGNVHAYVENMHFSSNPFDAKLLT